MEVESLEILEGGLSHLVTIAKFVLEAFSVICVITGFIKTLQFALRVMRKRNSSESFNQIRLQFGMWLALALEFQLGADILATTVAPTLESLAQLALIAVIRTFLNYFLGKELEAELKQEIELARLTQKSTILDE